MKQKTVVVLGMHRSGTSVVSGLLNIIGVNMGKKLEKGDNFNVRGYFEDLNIREVNKMILKELGGSWKSPPKLLDIDERLTNKIKEICTTQEGVWGWKDPRTVLLLDYYLPYLINPYFIICKRKEEEITASLVKRNNFSEDKCHGLIKEYNSRIDKFVSMNQKYPFLQLNFSDVKSEPVKTARKITSYLDLEYNLELDKKIERFIITGINMKFEKRRLRSREKIKSYYKSFKNLWKI